MKRSDKYFTNSELFKLTGLSKRQLEYLKKLGYITPINRNNPSYNFSTLIIAKIYLLMPTQHKAIKFFKGIDDWNMFIEENLKTDIILLDEYNVNMALWLELEKIDIEKLKFIKKTDNEIIKNISIKLDNVNNYIDGIKHYLFFKNAYIIHLKNIRKNLELKCIELEIHNYNEKIYA